MSSTLVAIISMFPSVSRTAAGEARAGSRAGFPGGNPWRQRGGSATCSTEGAGSPSALPHVYPSTGAARCPGGSRDPAGPRCSRGHGWSPTSGTAWPRARRGCPGHCRAQPQRPVGCQEVGGAPWRWARGEEHGAGAGCGPSRARPRPAVARPGQRSRGRAATARIQPAASGGLQHPHDWPSSKEPALRVVQQSSAVCSNGTLL